MRAYAFQEYDPERMARAMRRSESISTKDAIMIAKRLRGMTSDKALQLLDRVIAKKEAIPFTRFGNGAGHKPGRMAAGKYPVKAAASFKALLQGAVANAENKGLSTHLTIISILAQQASRPLKYGRQRGRQAKRTNIEVVLAEEQEQHAEKGTATTRARVKREAKKKAPPQKQKAVQKKEVHTVHDAPKAPQTGATESVKQDGN